MSGSATRFVPGLLAQAEEMLAQFKKRAVERKELVALALKLKNKFAALAPKMPSLDAGMKADLKGVKVYERALNFCIAMVDIRAQIDKNNPDTVLGMLKTAEEDKISFPEASVALMDMCAEMKVDFECPMHKFMYANERWRTTGMLKLNYLKDKFPHRDDTFYEAAQMRLVDECLQYIKKCNDEEDIEFKVTVGEFQEYLSEVPGSVRCAYGYVR